MTGRRATGLVAVVLAIVIGVGVVVLLVTGRDAQQQLTDAKKSSELVRSSLLAGEPAKARAELATVQAATAKARSDTSNVVWRAASVVPFLGRTPRAIADTTQVLDDVATQALPQIVDSADLLDPAALRTKGEVGIDVKRVQAAAPLLKDSSAELAQASEQLDAINLNGTPSAVVSGVDDVRESVDNLQSVVSDAARATALAGPMFGADGPRRYLFVVQTPSESRGTGGLMGAYGVLTVDGGRVSIERIGARRELDQFNLSKPAVDFGPDYTNLWGDDPGYWSNANLSPHYPYAAQLWQAMAARSGLGSIDGVITTDPVALAELLKVTGPAVLADGSTVSGERFTSLVTKDIYRKIPKDDPKRDAYLQQVAGAALTSILSGRGDAQDFLKTLGRMADERRLLVWSGAKDEEAVLATEPVGGAVPLATDDDASPYVMVAVNNIAGTKLDAYLEREVEYTGGPCPTDPTAPRSTQVKMRLVNSAPSGLPPYVTIRGDLADPRAGGGANKLLVAVYLSKGTGLNGVTLGGKPLKVGGGNEQGHPVITFPLELAPGAVNEVVLDLSEPAWRGDPRVDVQPLVRNQKTVVGITPC